MEQRNPYLQDVMNFVEKSVSAMPAKFDEVEVVINPKSKTFVAYTDELYANITMAISMKGGVFNVTHEEFVKYCENLISLRVSYVRKERISFGPTERIVVPSFLSLILSNIGIARHVDYGIELVPKIEQVEKLTDVEMRRISNSLKLLKGMGFEYAEGYARDREGSLEFMTFALIDGMVYSISKDSHPVYALLACTLGIRGIEGVLSPRVSYGMEEHLLSLVRVLATLKV